MILMAVQVIPQEELAVSSGGGMFAGMGDFVGWLVHYWWAWLLLLVLIILVGVLYYMYKLLEDERRQRDDVVYLRYRNLMKSCEDNAKSSWLREYWNPMSLLLLPLVVIGWILIPFIKKEASARIRNIDGDFVGWYMGHTFCDDGVYALMYYTKKSWFFFKIPKIILLPSMVSVSTFDESGKEHIKYIDVEPYRINSYNGDHDLNIKDVLKRGQYYYFPVFVTKDHKPINLSATMVNDLQKYTGYEIIENLVSDYSKSMRSAVQINADVRKEQLKDEKPKDADGDE